MVPDSGADAGASISSKGRAGPSPALVQPSAAALRRRLDDATADLPPSNVQAESFKVRICLPFLSLRSVFFANQVLPPSDVQAESFKFGTSLLVRLSPNFSSSCSCVVLRPVSRFE